MGKSKMENPSLPLPCPESRSANPGSFRVLGVRVDARQIVDVIAQMQEWIAKRSVGHFVAFTGMHGVSEARRDASFKRILNSADLVVADGMPLVWLGRRHGCDMRRRVYGPELVETFCCNTGPAYRHYFYGGGPGVAERVAEVLRQRYDVRTVGTYCPPFRTLSPQEEAEVARRIRAAAPDILWVGLGTPKQERWMYEHRERLGVPVMAGVGAAFDFLAGTVKQAPAWMRENGLEWCYRLAQEPRRLANRYLVLGSRFACSVLLETLKNSRQ
jgi:N-acetylglucosaminyldiphosphoundecaprenol N-acetyl-beta-D-mannosaminyltransferase